MDPGSRMDLSSSEDAIEAKMALPLMLHRLRAKGSSAAFINSKNPMWPVAEFSRSHVLAHGLGSELALMRAQVNEDA